MKNINHESVPEMGLGEFRLLPSMMNFISYICLRILWRLFLLRAKFGNWDPFSYDVPFSHLFILSVSLRDFIQYSFPPFFILPPLLSSSPISLPYYSYLHTIQNSSTFFLPSSLPSFPLLLLFPILPPYFPSLSISPLPSSPPLPLHLPRLSPSRYIQLMSFWPLLSIPFLTPSPPSPYGAFTKSKYGHPGEEKGNHIIQIFSIKIYF